MQERFNEVLSFDGHITIDNIKSLIPSGIITCPFLLPFLQSFTIQAQSFVKIVVKLVVKSLEFRSFFSVSIL
jgi:hypothetical protein